MNSENLKDLFENLQEGTVLAFYRGGIIGSLIPFFTREKKGEQAPHHVAIVYEVQRHAFNNHSICHFKLSEQGFHGGQYRDVEIVKYYDFYNNTQQIIHFTNDEYFLKQNSVEMFKTKMNDSQIQLGIIDAVGQVGKKYGFTRLVLGAEILEKLLPQKFQQKLFARFNKKEVQRVCSTHVHFNLRKAGFDLPKDTFYSPLEITKLDIYV